MNRAHLADMLDRFVDRAAPRHDDPPEVLTAYADLYTTISDGLTGIRATVTPGSERWADLAVTAGRFAVVARQLREEAASASTA